MICYPFKKVEVDWKPLISYFSLKYVRSKKMRDFGKKSPKYEGINKLVMREPRLSWFLYHSQNRIIKTGEVSICGACVWSFLNEMKEKKRILHINKTKAPKNTTETEGI